MSRTSRSFSRASRGALFSGRPANQGPRNSSAAAGPGSGGRGLATGRTVGAPQVSTAADGPPPAPQRARRAATDGRKSGASSRIGSAWGSGMCGRYRRRCGAGPRGVVAPGGAGRASPPAGGRARHRAARPERPRRPPDRGTAPRRRRPKIDLHQKPCGRSAPRLGRGCGGPVRRPAPSRAGRRWRPRRGGAGPRLVGRLGLAGLEDGSGPIRNTAARASPRGWARPAWCCRYF